MKSESGPSNSLAAEKLSYSSEYGSTLVHEGVAYAVSQDGDLQVPIPNDIAEHISLVMRLQDKAYQQQDEDALAFLQTFNCRKSALIVSGVLDIEDSIVDMGVNSGEKVMFEDIERMLAGQYGSVVVLKDYAEFESALDNYEGTFPCMVHAFESDTPIPVEDFAEQVELLHRVHSFIVLGQDEEGYVCFQKVGPALDEPFTITDLSFITHLYRNQQDRTGYFVFGPYK